MRPGFCRIVKPLPDMITSELAGILTTWHLLTSLTLFSLIAYQPVASKDARRMIAGRF